jgi:hypothetical protein
LKRRKKSAKARVSKAVKMQQSRVENAAKQNKKRYYMV